MQRREQLSAHPRVTAARGLAAHGAGRGRLVQPSQEARAEQMEVEEGGGAILGVFFPDLKSPNRPPPRS